MSRVPLLQLFPGAQWDVLPEIGRVLSYPTGIGHYAFAKHIGINGGHLGEVLKAKRISVGGWRGGHLPCPGGKSVHGRPFYVRPVVCDHDWNSGYMSPKLALGLLKAGSASLQFASLQPVGLPSPAPTSSPLPVAVAGPLPTCSGADQSAPLSAVPVIMQSSAQTLQSRGPAHAAPDLSFDGPVRSHSNVTVELKISGEVRCKRRRSTSSSKAQPSSKLHSGTGQIAATNPGATVDDNIHVLDDCDEDAPSPFLAFKRHESQAPPRAGFLRRQTSSELVDTMCNLERSRMRNPTSKVPLGLKRSASEEMREAWAKETLTRQLSGSRTAKVLLVLAR